MARIEIKNGHSGHGLLRAAIRIGFDVQVAGLERFRERIAGGST